MFIVYVKHYMTEEGKKYLNDNWFPRVEAIMSKQKGYVSLYQIRNKDEKDCLNFAVIFVDQASFQAWAQIPEHDALIDELDKYRSRSYFEYVYSMKEVDNLDDLPWEKVTINQNLSF